MKHLTDLRGEMATLPCGHSILTELIRYRAYRTVYGLPTSTAKAMVQKIWFEEFPIHIYESDRIAGSRRGNFIPTYDENELGRARRINGSYGQLGFGTNSDHFAPGYERFLHDGIAGVMARIEASLVAHADAPEKVAFLAGQRTVLAGFSTFIRRHAEAARKKAETASPAYRASLTELAADLDHIAWEAPVTLRQALNLVWLCYITFLFEGKYAMAFGRMDQYLYPYYRHDIDAGILTDTDAEDLFACAFLKIGESRYIGGDDVCNIAIGGIKPDGSDGINALSYIILHAVRDCNIPGPNLSARMHDEMPTEFLDECLQVIGTGLGYPALMNDRVNIPALHRHGYAIDDARDYCFVGCIENFIPGKQPAWSDGRFNVPQFLEAVFYRGSSARDAGYMGLDTGDLALMTTMDDFLAAFEKQIDFAAQEYVSLFNNMNGGINYAQYHQHFMSLFCDDCIERGMDINCGGAKYPSVHGAGCMGIATIADSLAAVEKLVYIDRVCTLEEMRDALLANFAGYERLRAQCRACPKYGNDDDFVDKYAVWYVDVIDRCFAPYRTRDGGVFYTAIASNVQNVSAGSITGATPDGRLAGVPVSDAASPTYGMDQNGPTAAYLSLSKPDYTRVSCGTVVNQKYTPDILNDPTKRAALAAALRVYFAQGGQEVQINCVSRAVLQDAMEHPADYGNLVVRVSGFSAYYTTLERDVQTDILNRTEHAAIH